MTGLLSTLLSNKGHLSGYTILVVMFAAAYFTANEKINDLSLEVGELRAASMYQTQIIEDFTERCE